MASRNQSCQGTLDTLTLVWMNYILQRSQGSKCLLEKKMLRSVHFLVYLTYYYFFFQSFYLISVFKWNLMGFRFNGNLFRMVQWSLAAWRIFLCSLIWLPREGVNCGMYFSAIYIIMNSRHILGSLFLLVIIIPYLYYLYYYSLWQSRKFCWFHWSCKRWWGERVSSSWKRFPKYIS